MSFWCWIPILTQKVDFEYHIIRSIEDELENVNSSDEEFIRSLLETEDYALYRNSSQEKFKIIICIKNYKIQHIFAFDSMNTMKAHAQSSIYDDGLVEIILDSDIVTLNDEIKSAVAKAIYMLILDIYDSYTIRKDGELTLRPVLADNKKEAIEKLLNQYDRKIILYHRYIKIDTNYKCFDEAIDLVILAKKDMEYASRFVLLMKEYIDDFESIIDSFHSISLLLDEVKFKYNNNMSKLLNRLTYIIILLTLPMTFEAINSLLQEIKLFTIPLFEKEFFGMNFSLTLTKLLVGIYIIIFILLIIKLSKK